MAVQSVRPEATQAQSPKTHIACCGDRSIDFQFSPDFETSTMMGMRDSLVSAAVAICRLAHLSAKDTGSQAHYALLSLPGIEFLLDMHQAISDEARARVGGEV